MSFSASIFKDASILDRLGVGGIFVGGKWLRGPETWGDYAWFVNEVLPNDDNDMFLFLQCGTNIRLFILAILGKWDVIERVAAKMNEAKR